MVKNDSIYVGMMTDSLHRKKRVLKSIYELTCEQEKALKADELDYDKFQEIVDEKGKLIDELTQIDNGFDSLFKRMEAVIKANRDAYKSDILTMQDLIREISELGIQIQALEKQNSEHFKIYLANEKKEIKSFHMNRKISEGYYQHMANTQQAEQSYFFDKNK